MSTRSRKTKNSGNGAAKKTAKKRKTASSQDEDATSTTASTTSVLPLAPPPAQLDDSLRFSQVARLLDASSEDASMMLGNSSGGGLGNSTDSSFWKLLETEDPSEVTKAMRQNHELQHQLLKTAHLLRSSQDGAEGDGGEGEYHHNNTANGQETPLSIPPHALFGSQEGHNPNPLTQSQLLNVIIGSGEGLDAVDLSASTNAILSSFIKQENASQPQEPPEFAPPASKPNIRKAMGTPSASTSSSSSLPTAPAAAAALAGLGISDQGGTIIAQLFSVEETVDNQLKAMKFQQALVVDNIHNRPELDKLIKGQADLRKQIEQAAQRLEQLNDTHILSASDAHRVVCMMDNFSLHARRLRLLQEELFQAQSGQTVKPVAALVITKQPFPCTVKQSKSVDDSVEVVLITGSKSEIQVLGQVKAELINEDYNPISKKKNSAPAIQNAAETMDESLVAVFKRLTFPHGSRVKSVNMRFAQELTLNGVAMRLLSDPTKPFIVMTNHGQRSTTEGKLLKKHTFSNRSEIPWPAFANAMQLHYIRATKQDPKKPARPLSSKDVEYLHLTKFNGKLSINQEDYDQFWAWFGTILYKVRNHQKHILPMWIKGLIYGFLSREDSDRLLQTQGAMPGSFLIRFSDRCAGQFVVVYVTAVKNADGGEEKEVKHYLINPEDIEKKSTLPDFLRDCENLWYLLQVVRDPDTGVVSLRPRNKDEILAPYYSREKSQTLLLGYDNRQP